MQVLSPRQKRTVSPLAMHHSADTADTADTAEGAEKSTKIDLSGLYTVLDNLNRHPAYGLSLVRTIRGDRMAIVLGNEVFDAMWTSAMECATEGCEPTERLMGLDTLLRRHASDYTERDDLLALKALATASGAKRIAAAAESALADLNLEEEWDEYRAENRFPVLGEVSHTIRRRIERYLCDGVFAKENNEVLNDAACGVLLIPTNRGGVSDEAFKRALAGTVGTGTGAGTGTGTGTGTGGAGTGTGGGAGTTSFLQKVLLKTKFRALLLSVREGGEDADPARVKRFHEVLSALRSSLERSTTVFSSEEEGGELADDEGAGGGGGGLSTRKRRGRRGGRRRRREIGRAHV